MAHIRKNGRNWQAIVRKKGFDNQSKSFPLKRDAIAWANVIESEMVRGTFVDTTTANSTSFAECLDRYEKEQTQAGRRSLKQLKSQLNIVRRSDLVKLSLANVSPTEIAKFQKERMGTGIKTSTYIKDHNLLHTIFETIQRGWGITLPKGNPVKLISKPKHRDPTSRNRRLEDDEEKLILSALRKISFEAHLVVRFALSTGMRRGEIVNIRLEDFNLNRSTLTIPTTKTDYPRVIPLTKEAHTILAETLAAKLRLAATLPQSRKAIMEFEPLAPAPKLKPQNATESPKLFNIKADSVTHAFKKACKKVGIENLTLHDLRHEAISRLFEAGLDMMEVSHISGHKSFEMLKKYTHLRPENILQKLQDRELRTNNH